MNWNKQIFAWHQWLGLITGIFIVILSITGALLVFAPEIDTWQYQTIQIVKPQNQRLTYTQLLKPIQQKYPDWRISNIHLFENEANKAVRFEIYRAEREKQKLQIFVNPYTAQITGERWKESAMMKVMLEIHNKLLWKPVGETIVAFLGLALLFVTISGIYFYRKSIFQVYKIGIRWRKNAKTLSSDLHKWVGVNALLFNLMIAFTGFYMHADKLNPFYYAHKEKKYFHPELQKINQSPDLFIQVARQQQAGFVPEVLDFPMGKNAEWKVKGNTANSWRIFGKHNFHFHFSAKNTKLTKKINLQTASLGERTHHIIEELHYGQYGGWFLKIIYALGGLSAGLLSITGFILWWKKKQKENKTALAKSMQEKSVSKPKPPKPRQKIKTMANTSS